MIKDKIEYGILIKQLNEAADAYYNSDTPIMSDQEYDLKLEELKQFEDTTGIKFANSPTQSVGAPILSELKKVAITPKPMLSLDKCHTKEEVKSFCGDRDVFASLKCDGLSVRLKYQDGVLVSANTRGNGTEGTDITEHVRQFYNTPTTIGKPKEYIIDGEAVIKYSDFAIVNKNGEFKNPRNTAAGALALLDMTEVRKRRLTFIAWEVIQGGSYDSKVRNLGEALNLGFEVAPFCGPHLKHDDVDEINDFIRDLNPDIPNDGVVWKYDDIAYAESLGATSHHERSGIAWKPEVEVAESRLKYIDWTMGRTGVLTPVAVFDPVELDGSIVERASLHNYSMMRKTLGDCAYVGEPVKIIKANLIIPQIVEAGPHMNYGEVIAAGGVSAHDAPECCPYCGHDLAYQRSDGNVENIICDNPQCEGKLTYRLEYFCDKKGLDIKGLSEMTISKLIEWGWLKEFSDIFDLYHHRNEWIQKPGFGEKSVDKILAAIEDTKKSQIPLSVFISAIGIPLIGPAQAKELAKHFKTFPEFVHATEENSEFDFYSIEGFGSERVASILDFDYTEACWVYTKLEFALAPEEHRPAKDTSLQDITVCITGSLKTYKNRAALQKVIEERGGKVSNSISGKTSYLINNDISSGSSKNLAAKKLGIPIITEQEFIDKFLA